MCPALAYVKEDCCIDILGSMQLKFDVKVQLQGPPLSNPTCLPTCIYFSYLNCIHHLPTSPTSYSTAPATTRPPPLLLTPGVHHTPRWPRPRRPAPALPCPAVKEPYNGPRDPD